MEKVQDVITLAPVLDPTILTAESIRSAKEVIAAEKEAIPQRKRVLLDWDRTSRTFKGSLRKKEEEEAS